MVCSAHKEYTGAWWTWRQNWCGVPTDQQRIRRHGALSTQTINRLTVIDISVATADTWSQQIYKKIPLKKIKHSKYREMLFQKVDRYGNKQNKSECIIVLMWILIYICKLFKKICILTFWECLYDISKNNQTYFLSHKDK